MSDNSVCPMCGHDWFGSDRCPHRIADYFDEIARLRAALEKAEKNYYALHADASRENIKHQETRAALEMAEFEAKRYSDILDSTRLVRDMLAIERDEARKWARFWYRAYNEDV